MRSSEADTRARNAGRNRAPASDREPTAGEQGFALLVSLIAIVGLTALATGGFFLANSERRVASNHQASVEALYLAEAGLSQYLGGQKGTPPEALTVQGQYDLAKGTATVTTKLVGRTTSGSYNPGVYRITSRGAYDPNGTGDPVVRRIHRLALLNPAVVPKPPASFSSGGGVNKSGTSGVIDGNDNCGAGSTMPGLIFPTGEFSYSGNKFDKTFKGDPDTLSMDNPHEGTIDQSTWESLTDPSNPLHDDVVDDQNSTFPSSFDGMPITFIDQDSYSLGKNESGSGLLIARGDLTLKGGFEWDGIILTGGSLTDQGVGTVEGGVITGLNTLLGESVSQDDLADTDELNGTKKFLFDSCFIDQVMSQNAMLVSLPGTWNENM